MNRHLLFVATAFFTSQCCRRWKTLWGEAMELDSSSLEQLQLPWDLKAAPSACREITEPGSLAGHGRRMRRNGCKRRRQDKTAHSPWEWSSSGASCPQMFNLHHRRFLRPDWRKPWAIWSNLTPARFWQGVGLDPSWDPFNLNYLTNLQNFWESTYLDISVKIC